MKHAKYVWTLVAAGLLILAACNSPKMEKATTNDQMKEKMPLPAAPKPAAAAPAAAPTPAAAAPEAAAPTATAPASASAKPQGDTAHTAFSRTIHLSTEPGGGVHVVAD